MHDQQPQPANGDWSKSKQAIAIGACILTVVSFTVGATLGGDSSSGAAPQAGGTVTVTATATKTVKVRVTKKPKPTPTNTVTVTARPKPRTADSENGADSGGSRNCTPGYSPCLAPASDYDCRSGSGDGPKYTGPVRVTGSDPYDLDRDGDGKACEWS
jgi:hypothetical protein